MNTNEELTILQAYSTGKAGTRATIEQIGGQDYADLLVALGKYDLDLPKPDATGREEQLLLASSLLRPLLTKPLYAG